MKVAISLDAIALADVEKGHAIDVVVLQALGPCSHKETRANKWSKAVCTALGILACLLVYRESLLRFSKSYLLSPQ